MEVQKSFFKKVSGRRRQNIIEINISAGGVASIPLYLEKTRRFLTGKEVTAENIREAARIMQQEIAPISDVRGSADYKRLLLRQLFFAHFLKFFPDLLELEALL
ncbi:MAG: hypothetical protein KAW12_22965 [Candidatus Aminicenantes bacterium]|nr:hypothetical protein [Candidatus Aminicenantes bacterium]